MLGLYLVNFGITYTRKENVLSVLNNSKITMGTIKLTMFFKKWSVDDSHEIP